jgi:phosphotransferase system  glucose/maltose/N-acetylglucosamine-specific IIC component
VLAYPVGRERSISTGLFIGGLASLGFTVGGGWFLAQELLSEGGGFAWIAGLVGIPMVLLFGLFGLLLALLGLHTGLNALTVTLSDTEIEARRSVRGIPVSRSVPLGEVDGIEMKINGQLGQGSKAAVFYGIRAYLRDGSSIPMGDGLRGPTLAEEAARVISEETGIPVRLVERRRKLRKRAKETAATRAAALRVPDPDIHRRHPASSAPSPEVRPPRRSRSTRPGARAPPAPPPSGPANRPT